MSISTLIGISALDILENVDSVTVADVNTSISTYSFDHGENDEFSSRLDKSTRKGKILSLQTRIIDCHDVIRLRLSDDFE